MRRASQTSRDETVKSLRRTGMLTASRAATRSSGGPAEEIDVGKNRQAGRATCLVGTSVRGRVDVGLDRALRGRSAFDLAHDRQPIRGANGVREPSGGWHRARRFHQLLERASVGCSVRSVGGEDLVEVGRWQRTAQRSRPFATTGSSIVTSGRPASMEPRAFIAGFIRSPRP